jgi:hypothetical protein
MVLSRVSMGGKTIRFFARLPPTNIGSSSFNTIITTLFFSLLFYLLQNIILVRP